MTNLSGGCLCGRIRYRVTSELGPLVYCHCGQCQKAQGCEAAANTPVPSDAFEITEGSTYLATFRASPGKARHFCNQCGSALYSRVDDATHVRIRAGTLDGEPTLRPSAHIFSSVDMTARDSCDGLPCYTGREPGRR